MPRSRGRTGSVYERLKQRVYREETHCWLCGERVDPALRFPHPQSRSLDHILALADGGAEVDRENARLAHLVCNQRKSGGHAAKTPHIIDATTQDWLA